MNAWFENLEARERGVLVAGAIFTAVSLVYLLIWRPLSERNENLAEDIEAQRRLLTDLVQAQGRITPPGGGTAAADTQGQSLVVVVSQSVDRFQLQAALKSSQPAGPDAIRVTFENASFDTMVNWLGELSSRNGLSVQSASFGRTELPGRVNSSITLERQR